LVKANAEVYFGVGIFNWYYHISDLSSPPQILRAWLGGAYLAKKVPHAATTPIATAFKICISHRKNGLLIRLPTKVSFSVFD
jgi:hypothetical protein